MTVRLIPAQGALRVLRGTILATTSASLSVAVHTAAGGTLPDPGMTTVITSLMAVAGVALADRRRGSRDIVGAFVLCQLTLHIFLQVVGSHGHDPQAPKMPFDPWAMTLGHLVVAVLTGLALAHADRALFVVARMFARILPRKVDPLPIAVPLPTVCIPATNVRPLAEILYRLIHSRRGPPAVS